MTFTTRKTEAGRTIIESDGYIEYYKAYEQGALVCKVSIPAGMDAETAIMALRGLRAPNAGANYIDWIREAVPGIRVMHWSRIQ